MGLTELPFLRVRFLSCTGRSPSYERLGGFDPAVGLQGAQISSRWLNCQTDVMAITLRRVILYHTLKDLFLCEKEPVFVDAQFYPSGYLNRSFVFEIESNF